MFWRENGLISFSPNLSDIDISFGNLGLDLSTVVIILSLLVREPFECYECHQ